MLFVERKTEQGYSYDAHNVIGKLHIDSVEKLDGDTLDSMVGLLIRKNLTAQTINGTVEYGEGKSVSYTLERESQWQESGEHDTDETWSDSPTSTQEQENVSTQKHAWKTRILSWCLKCVEGLHKRLKSYQHKK